LSAVIAWLLDDYGAGEESIKFYNNNIPPDQRKIHEATQKLIKDRIGAYKDIMAESKHPGSNPELTDRARALGNSRIPLLWVQGNDPKRAERAFLTINQSAVEIDPTEFTILNSRSKPNAISARAIVRNGTGHKYWHNFSSGGQEKVVKHAKLIYSSLYSPPLQPPIRTSDLPIAGPGYGTQTLPLIFDFVNIANDVAVVDSSKPKKKKLDIVEHASPDENLTVQYLTNTRRLSSLLTGTSPASLGLHPAVYFYALNGRHQATAVLAFAFMFHELEQENMLIDFCKARKNFEDFLVNHKVFVNQLTTRHGSMAKGFRPMKEYFRFVLDQFFEGKNEQQIEEILRGHGKYQSLVKEQPVRTTKPKKLSGAAKDVLVFSETLGGASICEICGARIDLKSMHADHIEDRSKGGLGTVENSRPAHPYCDSTYKYEQEKLRKEHA